MGMTQSKGTQHLPVFPFKASPPKKKTSLAGFPLKVCPKESQGPPPCAVASPGPRTSSAHRAPGVLEAAEACFRSLGFAGEKERGCSGGFVLGGFMAGLVYGGNKGWAMVGLGLVDGGFRAGRTQASLPFWTALVVLVVRRFWSWYSFLVLF